jgi:pimeloyl-ACP methyl ester carboxylesterase
VRTSHQFDSEDSGGSTIVFAHGIGGPASSIDPLMEACSAQGVPSITPGISGHRDWKSCRFMSPQWWKFHLKNVQSGVDDIAAGVRHAYEKQETENVTLVGYSMGAFYQLIYLALSEKIGGEKYPSVNNNVFIAPAPAGMAASRKVAEQYPIEYLVGSCSSRVDNIIRVAEEMFIGEDVEPLARKRILRDLNRVAMRAYIQFMGAEQLVSGYPKKGTLKGPAKILLPDDDRLLDHRHAEKVRSFFDPNGSDVSEQVIESCSHFGILYKQKAADVLCEEAQKNA